METGAPFGKECCGDALWRVTDLQVLENVFAKRICYQCAPEMVYEEVLEGTSTIQVALAPPCYPGHARVGAKSDTRRVLAYDAAHWNFLLRSRQLVANSVQSEFVSKAFLSAFGPR